MLLVLSLIPVISIDISPTGHSDDPDTKVIKLFMLNSTDHEISTAHKN